MRKPEVYKQFCIFYIHTWSHFTHQLKHALFLTIMCMVGNWYDYLESNMWCFIFDRSLYAFKIKFTFAFLIYHYRNIVLVFSLLLITLWCINALSGKCFLWAVTHLCICKIGRKEAPATYQQWSKDDYNCAYRWANLSRSPYLTDEGIYWVYKEWHDSWASDGHLREDSIAPNALIMSTVIQQSASHAPFQVEFLWMARMYGS